MAALATDVLASAVNIGETGISFSERARWLIWPLSVVATLDVVPKPARQFAVRPPL